MELDTVVPSRSDTDQEQNRKHSRFDAYLGTFFRTANWKGVLNCLLAYHAYARLRLQKTANRCHTEDGIHQ